MGDDVLGHVLEPSGIGVGPAYQSKMADQSDTHVNNSKSLTLFVEGQIDAEFLILDPTNRDSFNNNHHHKKVMRNGVLAAPPCAI